MNNNEVKDDAKENNGYLLFTIGAELYGTRIEDIREVVELGTMKTLPNTVDCFAGITNLRGQIVSVIDLRIRFGVEKTSPRPVILLFECEQGAVGALVDKIKDVTQITNIETTPNVIAKIPQKYLLGIGSTPSGLVTIVDLKTVLSIEELATINATETENLDKVTGVVAS